MHLKPPTRAWVSAAHALCCSPSARLDASEVEAAGGGGFVLKADPSVKVGSLAAHMVDATWQPPPWGSAGDVFEERLPFTLPHLPRLSLSMMLSTPPACSPPGHRTGPQDVQVSRQRDQPGRRGVAVRRRLAAPVRDVHGAAAGHQGGRGWGGFQSCLSQAAFWHAWIGLLLLHFYSKQGRFQARVPPRSYPSPPNLTSYPSLISPSHPRSTHLHPHPGVVHQGRGGGAPLPGPRVPPVHRAAAERGGAGHGAAASAAPDHQEGGSGGPGQVLRSGARWWQPGTLSLVCTAVSCCDKTGGHPHYLGVILPILPPPTRPCQVTEETEEMRFNTALAAMMEFVNGAYKWGSRPRAALQPFILLLAPYAPHLGAWPPWSQRLCAQPVAVVCLLFRRRGACNGGAAPSFSMRSCVVALSFSVHFHACGSL
jgi:hypothetical protein